MVVTKGPYGRKDPVKSSKIRIDKDGVIPFTVGGVLVKAGNIAKKTPFECTIETCQLFKRGTFKIEACLNDCPVSINIAFHKGNKDNEIWASTEIQKESGELLYSEVDTTPFTFMESDNTYKVSYTPATDSNGKRELTKIEIIDVTEES